MTFCIDDKKVTLALINMHGFMTEIFCKLVVLLLCFKMLCCTREVSDYWPVEQEAFMFFMMDYYRFE